MRSVITFQSHSDHRRNPFLLLLAGLVFIAFPCCSQSPGRETPQVTPSSPTANSLAKDFKYPFYHSSSLDLNDYTASQRRNTEKKNNKTASQRRNTEKFDMLNDKGQKEGLWVEHINYRVVETYYRNGIPSGAYMEFNRKGRLQVYGNYKNGQMSGTWFCFDETGRLRKVYKDFYKNTYSVFRETDGRKYGPDYMCYCLSYYRNGNKQDEGILLWLEGDDPVSDGSVEYGTWKYYDDAGRLIKTKIFK